MSFLTGGKITWIGVKEGDIVKKYQAVASMDQRQVQETLKKYLSTYMKSRWTFDQIKDNYKDTAVSTAMQRLLDESQFDLNNTVSDVKIQSLAIEYANLYSPIDGIVTRVSRSIAGNAYLPTQAEFDIVNPETIYFSATADQTDVIKLYEKMDGTLILDSLPDRELPATISSISYTPKAGETGTVYEIKLAFDKNSASDASLLRLGMTGDITFITSQQNDVLAIPTKYIKTEGSTKYVWILSTDGKKIKQTITVGTGADTETEITSGLAQGDLITE